jgi:hypothetical protein
VKLAELEPRWISGGGRRGLGVMFNCPGRCCQGPGAVQRLPVWFANPLDGGASAAPDGRGWQRTGETFEALTLTPSIDASGTGHFHGFVTAGEVVGA